MLASDVGEARRLIGENGQLLRYAGGRDLAYARAMAAAVVALPDRAELDRRGASGVERAREFGWEHVADRFCQAVELAVGGGA